MENYLKLNQFSLWNYHYIFIDCKEYLADQLFIKHKVTVDFGQEFAREDTDYRIICCKIHKKDETAFLEALSEMYHKMLLLGYRDYEEFCESFQKIISTGLSNKDVKLCGLT